MLHTDDSTESSMREVQPLSGALFWGLWIGDSRSEPRIEKRNNPPWADIAAWLERLRACSGKVELMLMGDATNIESEGVKDQRGNLIKEVRDVRRSLSISKADSYFWVTLLDNETSDDFGIVRTYTNPNPNPKLKGLKIEVYPDMYANEAEVIEDFDLVADMAREFYQTGDVSHDLLD